MKKSNKTMIAAILSVVMIISTLVTGLPQASAAGAKTGGSITSKIYQDLNGNSLQDSSEPGISGVKVHLYSGATGLEVAQATTNTNGTYTFSGLTAGPYYINVETPVGFKFFTGNVSTDGYSSYVNVTDGSSATINAGMFPIYGKVSSVIWNDVNKNGIKDGSESGVSGVNVHLFGFDGVEIANVNTDANGLYVFGNLDLSKVYYIHVDTPAGMALVPSGYFGGDGNSAYFSFNESQTITNLGVGLASTATASIGTTIFEDLNGNGVQDTGETGVANAGVDLYSGDGTKMKSTTTDANGKYKFSDLPAGVYYLHLNVPSQYKISSSAYFGADGNTAYINLQSGQQKTDVNAGLEVLPASINSNVWEDANKNGIKDAGEVGVQGANMTLYSAFGVQVGTTTSDAMGKYSFSNLDPGMYYVVAEAPTGYKTVANTAFGGDGATGYISLEAGQTVTSINYGVVKDIVPNEITVDPTSISTTVGGSGDITVTVLPVGADQSVTFTSNDTSIVTVDANGNWTALKAGTTTIDVTTPNNVKTTITVTVTDSSPVVTNVTVTPATATVKQGEKQDFNAVVTGTNSPAQTVTWTINSTHGSTVSATGEVSVSATEPVGTVLTVTATSTVDPSKKGTASVTVEAGSPVVTKVTVTPDSNIMKQGETKKFEAEVTGTNSPAQTVTWTIDSYSGSTASTVSADGVVSVSASEPVGSLLTVTATSTVDPSKSGSALIYVNAATPTVTDVTVTPDSTTMAQGETKTFSSVVTGTNSPAQTVTWSINSTHGSTVSATGEVSISASEPVGSLLTVTATSTVDPSKKGTAIVYVTAGSPVVTNVTVTPNEATVRQGDTKTFSAVVTGTNSPAQTVTWSINSTHGSTVNASGVISVSASEPVGTVLTVTATSTVDPSKKGTASVTVVQASPKFTKLLWQTGEGGHAQLGHPGHKDLTNDTSVTVSKNWKNVYNILEAEGGVMSWVFEDEDGGLYMDTNLWDITSSNTSVISLESGYMAYEGGHLILNMNSIGSSVITIKDKTTGQVLKSITVYVTA